MKTLRLLVLLLVTAWCGTLDAQTQKELKQLMRERNEYYFTLNVDNLSEIKAINEICSVDAVKGKTVVCYANQKQYGKLLEVGYKPELQTPPCMKEETVMWDGSNRAAYAWDSYPTYDAYQSMMEAFPSQALSDRTCTLLDLGTLNSGRKILGVRLNKGNPDGKPRFLYSSTMHGDEVTGMMLMLRLIDEFCTSTDSRIVSILENVDVFIFPLTNPDGTYYGGNSTINSARRYNINGTDLNRNYKDYYIGEHPDGESYALETQWTMQLAQDYLFTMSANYHGGAEVANYPWDAVYDRHPDDAWYQYVCLDYVSRARAVSSSYMTDTESSGITNGADWYVITGSRQDYENAYGQCREITMECSSTKKPSASTMPTYWNYNHDAMLGLLEQCTKGVHGIVYDAVTNATLEGVTITVENHDDNLSKITSHSVGDFHRVIKGGTYTFTFAKQGYYSQSVQVTVADGQRVDLEIYLEPNLNLNADFTASTTNLSLGQSINFTDTSEGMTTSWNWIFEGATPSTSTEQNPTVTYNAPGDYDVTLTVTGPGGTQTVTKENYIHVAESILMQNGSVTTCSGIFYDSGGANSNYGNNLTYTMTFYPGTEGAMVCVDFTQFNTESGYDYLYIYNGASTDATQIGRYDGTTSPGTVMATNEAGALTFKFTSDSGVNAAGWVATVSCFQTDVPVNITVSASPSNGGTVSGGGEFTFGQTCTVTATSKNGYSFMGWMENGTVVSQDLEYSFTAISDRDLVANFAHMTVIEIGKSETTNTFLPSYSYYKQALTQQIYTAEEIGTAGTITSIAFFNEATTARTRTYDFYLKATEKSSFSSKTDWITVATTDKVFSGSVTMTSGAWTTIVFDTPFEYDGITNLVLVADDNTGRYDSSPYMACSVYNTTSNQAIYYWDDNTNFNPMSPPTSSSSGSYGGSNSNGVLTLKNHIKLGIEMDTEEEQTTALTTGWNWFSSSVEADNLLEQLEEQLGANGIEITSKEGYFASYYEGYGWYSEDLTSLEVGKMYKIKTNASCTINLIGTPVNPANHPINIKPGFNWIGYPLNQPLDCNDALEGFNATPEDVIKGKNGYASFFEGYGWYGSNDDGSFILSPGQGFMYQSKATTDKTLVFPSSTK